MRWISPIHALLLALAAGAAPTALGQTVTVTIAADEIDIDTQTGTIADLPGPDGEVSFSEALIATNNTPGHQTIEFDVPASGTVLLTSITGFYFRAYESVTVDATMQPGSVSTGSNEVYFLADDCTLLGFSSCEVYFTGSNNIVRENTGMNIIVGTGSGTLVQNNTGGTLKIDQSSDNVVVGNTFQRLRVLGGSAAQPATNNLIGGPAPEDRNYITGYGTWNFSSGLPSGTAVQLWNTIGTVLEGNYIGTTTDGLEQGNPACTIGVSFEGENHDAVLRNNLIAGIRATGIGTWAGYQFGWAVIFWGTGGSNIQLIGNTIGLDANGDPVLGSVWGIDVGDSNGAGSYGDLRIGGALPGAGNVIAGHLLNGVTIGREASPVRLSGNQIYDNGWPGIDLIPTGYGYGVTPNDPLDADTGGNSLQNFPDVTSAARVGASTQVTGTLHSAPLGEYTIELFASTACDDSGFGEGEVFLGSTNTMTDAGGDGAFAALLPVAVTPGWVVTATATLEPLGETSEFSACVQVEPGAPVPGDATGDGLVNVQDILEIVLRWGPCEPLPDPCEADVSGDGVVGVEDLLMAVVNWTS